jgi:hypothetical protein
MSQADTEPDWFLRLFCGKRHRTVYADVIRGQTSMFRRETSNSDGLHKALRNDCSIALHNPERERESLKMLNAVVSIHPGRA